MSAIAIHDDSPLAGWLHIDISVTRTVRKYGQRLAKLSRSGLSNYGYTDTDAVPARTTAASRVVSARIA